MTEVGGSTHFAGVEIVGISGTSYADRSDVRFELAIETAERYQAANLPLVVADSSPGQRTGENWVQQELVRRSALVFPTEPGIASQRQQAARTALWLGAGHLLSHELEKVEMVNFAGDVRRALDTHDVLVIGRTAAAEASLPPAQRRTERLAGWILQHTHGLPPDSLSGGRGFTRRGAEYLLRYPAHEPNMDNWLYLYKTAIDAMKDDVPVGGLAVDLRHPQAMFDEETGEKHEHFDRKRYEQFVMQLDHLLRKEKVKPESGPQMVGYLTLLAIAGCETTLPSNEVFADRLAKLEAQLKTLFKYDPVS
jgi:hypothetical protein